MLYKLAFRNAKRSLSDYAVCLITVTLSFSLMFSFGLVASSDAISGLSEGMDTFQMILDFINIIILFVICFLINYTTRSAFSSTIRQSSCSQNGAGSSACISCSVSGAGR